MTNSHRQTALVGGGRADVSSVVAAWSRVVVDRGVLLIVATWHREAGRRGVALVDRRLDRAVRRWTRSRRFHVEVVEAADVRPSSKTPRWNRLTRLRSEHQHRAIPTSAAGRCVFSLYFLFLIS